MTGYRWACILPTPLLPSDLGDLQPGGMASLCWGVGEARAGARWRPTPYGETMEVTWAQGELWDCPGGWGEAGGSLQEQP